MKSYYKCNNSGVGSEGESILGVRGPALAVEIHVGKQRSCRALASLVALRRMSYQIGKRWDKAAQGSGLLAVPAAHETLSDART